jgi:hypothetical protein
MDKMDQQAVTSMVLVKTGPSLAERWARRVAARHHRNVITRLAHFREAVAADMAPEPWTMSDAPMVLTLADVCDALGLDEQEKALVLGESGQAALAEILESRVAVHPEQLLNARQMTALKYARRHGAINQGAYRQLYPDFSSETLRLDLADLVARGLMHKHGNCRGTYYTVA